jgi:hypothetical protein
VVAALLSALAPPKRLRQELGADLEDAELLAAAEQERLADVQFGTAVTKPAGSWTSTASSTRNNLNHRGSCSRSFYLRSLGKGLPNSRAAQAGQ